ncbi:hypothetical protein [uncultured Gimesia sp.]|uniref:hypothetical protein n=1 Tax=uncultured Gimesia sp. TaxID=1678688 RepID=UPI0026325117|nr:hypothetical protein [uncultured Gimesia sp.]
MKEQNGNTKDQDVIVTQDELRQLIELEEIRFKAEQLRSSIRNRILEGAKVEPGKHRVHINSHERIQLNVNNIYDLFGSMANEVLAVLPRQRIDRMSVITGKQTKKQADPKAVFDPSKKGSKINPGYESDLLRLFIDLLSPVESPDAIDIMEDEILVDLSESEIKPWGSLTFPESDYCGKK